MKLKSLSFSLVSCINIHSTDLTTNELLSSQKDFGRSKIDYDFDICRKCLYIICDNLLLYLCIFEKILPGLYHIRYPIRGSLIIRHRFRYF